MFQLEPAHLPEGPAVGAGDGAAAGQALDAEPVLRPDHVYQPPVHLAALHFDPLHLNGGWNVHMPSASCIESESGYKVVKLLVLECQQLPCDERQHTVSYLHDRFAVLAREPAVVAVGKVQVLEALCRVGRIAPRHLYTTSFRSGLPSELEAIHRHANDLRDRVQFEQPRCQRLVTVRHYPMHVRTLSKARLEALLDLVGEADPRP